MALIGKLNKCSKRSSWAFGSAEDIAAGVQFLRDTPRLQGKPVWMAVGHECVVRFLQVLPSCPTNREVAECPGRAKDPVSYEFVGSYPTPCTNSKVFEREPKPICRTNHTKQFNTPQHHHDMVNGVLMGRPTNQ